MADVKDPLEGQIRIFVKNHFWGEDMVVLLSINYGKTLYKKYLFFMVFFSKQINCGQNPSFRRHDTLSISKIWIIQLLLFDFAIMQRGLHHNVIFCYEIR